MGGIDGFLGGGSGGGGQDWSTVAYDNAYTAALQGQGWDTISQHTDQNYLDPAYAGFQAAQSQGGGGFSISMPSMPDTSSQFAAIMQQQAAAAEQAKKEAARTAGLNSRDALYSEYMNAAGTAVDFVNQQIRDEMANSKLLGIDYGITDEQKSQRISDYFASLWGEGQQAKLEGLFNEWGQPEGFEGFNIARGDAGNLNPDPASEKTVGTGKGTAPTKRTVIAEDEDDVLGRTGSVLGG